MIKLKTADWMTGLTGYEQELKVSMKNYLEMVCADFTICIDNKQSLSQSWSLVCAAANNFADKSCPESYINVFYVDVRDV